jgi:hypothetical protein
MDVVTSADKLFTAFPIHGMILDWTMAYFSQVLARLLGFAFGCVATLFGLRDSGCDPAALSFLGTMGGVAGTIIFQMFVVSSYPWNSESQAARKPNFKTPPELP